MKTILHSIGHIYIGSTIELVVNTSISDDGTTMNVSWQPITLEQARGFFVYRIVLTPLSSNKRNDLSKDVPPDQTSTTLTGLDPRVSYAVTAGVVNEDNPDLIGPVSSPVIVEP